MSKFTEKRIAEIESIINNNVTKAFNDGIDIDEYGNQIRTVLNLTVIQAIFGAEFTKPKKDGKSSKVKFNHKLANTKELSKISQLLNTLVAMEIKYMQESMNIQDRDIDDDDMDIPERVVTNGYLPTLDKVNKKKINEYIFGKEGQDSKAISRLYISGMDVLELAATAEKIHKTKIRNTAIIVGGISLVIIGGVATVSIINHKKKNSNDIDDIDIDLDDIDTDVILADDSGVDDVPVVTLD